MGYKSLTQMPAHHNWPVSSNVRPHSSQAVDHHRRRIQSSRNDLFRQSCSVPRERTAKASHAVFERMIYSEMRITVIFSLFIIYNSLSSNYEFSFCGNFQKVILVLGRRFAPACCAAQSVIRRGPCRAVPPHRLAQAAQISELQRTASITRSGKEI